VSAKTTPAARKKNRGTVRVLVLMHEDLVPPDSIEGLSDQEVTPFKTEFDVTTALRESGHEVMPLGVASDLGLLRDTLNSFKPRITFNLLEEFHGVAVYDQHVVSYLELMKRRYTGCNPRGLMLAHDKALSKQVMTYHRIPTAEFVVFPMGRKFRARRNLPFPMLVKSLTAEGSAGISQASVVKDEEQLRERTEFVHRQLGTDAIAERYIEGRELYVGVLGNLRLETLPIWELRFEKMPEDAAKIATDKVKWDHDYQEKRGISWDKADNVAPELAERISRICKRTYRALNLTGYARIDLRLTPEGRVFVLEANPNPDLSYGGEFAEAAEATGLSYQRLLDRILRLGLNYRAKWSES
jgi:D-alanine-D-alanine ligase